MIKQELSFSSAGTRCGATWFAPQGGGPFPAIVMAHGFGATRELGLEPFARAFCEAGIAALTFDYRHYGTSDGEPRELLSVALQRADYRAAIDFVRTLPRVDGRRIALWGTSFSGGHVLALSAEELGLRAVVAQVPFTSGKRTSRALPVSVSLRMTARGLRDELGSWLGQEPVYLPVLGKTGTLAFLAGDEHEACYSSLIPPEVLAAGRWHNRAAARLALTIAFVEPGAALKQARVPVLMVLAEDDALTPSAYAREAARDAPRATVVTVPGGHFGIYTGDTFQEVVAAELRFLRAQLAEQARDPAAQSSEHGAAQT